MIRLVVVDDEPLVRTGVRFLAEATPDIEICGEAGDGLEAVAVVQRTCPDVVLMDLRLPRLSGAAATSRILADRPGARVVALTTFSTDADIDAVLRAGAIGYLLKDDEPERVLQTVRAAATGEPTLTPTVLRRVVARSLDVHTQPRAPLPGGTRKVTLTPRERDVVAMVGTGASNGEIAAELHVSVTTVKTHISAAMDKVNARNRTQLAVAAYRLGLVTAR